MKELIDFLEKKGFTAEASSLKNGATSLDLQSKNIGDEGAKAIGAGLKANKFLTELNLNHNKISDEGAEAIGEGLKTNTSLIKLTFSFNQIGDIGVKGISEGLKTNTSLTTLDLSNNKIGDIGAKGISEVLKLNSSLVTLHLGNSIAHSFMDAYSNRIGDIGATAIIDVLKVNTTLTWVYVRCSGIKDAEAEAILEYGQKKAALQKKEQEALKIFPEKVKEIITKIETNNSIELQDKTIMQNSINDIAKTVQALTNKDDIKTIIKSIYENLNNKITKARIEVVKEDLNEIVERQIKLNESIRTEKLAIFQKVIADITTKLESNTTIIEKDKNIMQNSIKRIVDKVQKLANKTDIETITESAKEILSSKITKARIGVIEEDIEQLIEQQSKPNHDVIVNKVEELIYDKSILNHPELLQNALNNKLSPNLIQEAINNNDEELILAGLISLEAI